MDWISIVIFALSVTLALFKRTKYLKEINAGTLLSEAQNELQSASNELVSTLGRGLTEASVSVGESPKIRLAFENADKAKKVAEKLTTRIKRDTWKSYNNRRAELEKFRHEYLDFVE